jgi:hypothetical protein
MPRIIAAAVILLTALAASSCLPWDFKYETKLDYPKYPDKTPFDRFKESRLALMDPVMVAGAARINATPKKKTGVYMAGYNSNRRSTGVHDPIWVRCALLDDGKETLVFVSADVIGLFYDDISDARNLISQRWGDSVIVGSTHNHEGPDTMGIWGKSPFYTIPVKTGVDPVYQQFLKDAIAQCVFDAAENASPAVFRMANIDVPEGISENLHKAGFKENNMSLLEAVGREGRSIFTLVNWPMHVEVLDEGNNLISADWAGVMYREFEKNHDGVLVYMQGALGGMVVPRQSKYAPEFEKWRFMEVCGRVVADTARRGSENAEPVEIKNIVRRKASIQIPMENKDLMIAKKLGLIKRHLDGIKVSSEIDYIELGPARMVTVPGEALPAVGFRIKEILGSKYTFTLGLTMDELGYILPLDYWQDPVYEYEMSVSAGPKTSGIVFETLLTLMGSK